MRAGLPRYGVCGLLAGCLCLLISSTGAAETPNSGSEGFEVTGRAGPAMPAVPAGSVTAEVLYDSDNRPKAQTYNTSFSAISRGIHDLGSQAAAVISDPVQEALKQQMLRAARIPPPLPVPKPQRPENIQVAAAPVIPRVITPSVRVPTPTRIKPQPVPSGPRPLLTFFFPDASVAELDEEQISLLKKELEAFTRVEYTGVVQVISTARPDLRDVNQSRQLAMNRAFQVRQILIDYGISPKQLDVRALNKYGSTDQLTLLLK